MHTRALRWYQRGDGAGHAATCAKHCRQHQQLPLLPQPIEGAWALDSLCVAPDPICTYSNTRRKHEIKETLRCCRSVFQL